MSPINLELPKRFTFLTTQANQVATEVLRPNSRKYDWPSTPTRRSSTCSPH